MKERLEALAAKWRGCAACLLADGRATVVFGRIVGDVQEGDLLVIGEAPGGREDMEGQTFVGPSGQMLNSEMLGPAGAERVFITNTVCCLPPNNRTPSAAEMEACRPRLEEVVAVLQPRLVVVVGRTAAQALSVVPVATPRVSLTHPAWYLRQGHPTPATQAKLAKEVARLARAMKKAYGEDEEEEEPADHEHEPAVVGTAGSAPLRCCVKCGRRTA